MAGVGIKDAVRAPLFDRLSLIPEGGGKKSNNGILDRAGQRESLRRELVRLLNTRSPYPNSKKMRPEERTVIDYGLPDYSEMYTHSPDDKKKLANLVRWAVEAYEPRLDRVEVEVEVVENSDKAMLVKISGALRNGKLMERISFSLQVSGEDLDGSQLGS